MTVATTDLDVSNDEAILHDGRCIGYVTSGGFAHYVGKSVALGYVPTDIATPGVELEIEINGQMYPAEVLGQPLYDPEGAKARGTVA